MFLIDVRCEGDNCRGLSVQMAQILSLLPAFLSILAKKADGNIQAQPSMIEDRRRRRATPARVIDGENGVIPCEGTASPPLPHTLRV